MSTIKSTYIQKVGVGTDAFELPANDGTSGQYLQTNGSGTLSWQTVASAAFESYAVIADQKTSGTAGGAFVNNAWRTRDLNTELIDPDGIVSISSNQFTLQAGTYLIKWGAPAYRVNVHRSALYDITNSAFVEYSESAYSNTTGNVYFVARGSTRVVITGATTYEIQHQCGTTNTAGDTGLGVATAIGGPEIFTVVEIYKEA